MAFEFKFDEPPPPAPKLGKLEPGYIAPYQAWQQAPGPETNHAMLQAVQPILNSALMSVGATASPTVASRAKTMALKALKSYKPERGTLRTHLLSQLQSLQRVAAKTNNIISLPEQVALDRRHLLETETDLEDQLGRPPSMAELQRRTGLSAKRIAYIRSARMPVAESRLTDDQGEVFAPGVAGIGSNPTEQAWHEFVYGDLNPVQQSIMEHTLGMHGRPVLSNRELARKFGVSEAAISQHKAKIQKLLDARFETSILGG